MADTARSRAALLTLLADNVAGDVSPQDVRDMLVSVHGVYGEMYIADNSGGSASTVGTTFQKVVQLTSSGASSGVTVDVATDHDLTVGTDGVYQVAIAVAFSGSNSATYTVSLYKNGARESQVSLERKLGVSGDVGSAHTSGLVSCSASDVLTAYVKADGAGKSFLIHQGNVSVSRIA